MGAFFPLLNLPPTSPPRTKRAEERKTATRSEKNFIVHFEGYSTDKHIGCPKGIISHGPFLS